MKIKRQICLLIPGLVLLAACTQYLTVPQPNNPSDPNDSDPIPTALPTGMMTSQPTASPVTVPTSTPGWFNVALVGRPSNFPLLLAEARRLQVLGQVSDVTDLGDRVRLNGSVQSISELQLIAASEVYPFTTLSQRNVNGSESFTRIISTEQEFNHFWRTYITSLDPVPSVDFSNQAVIAIYPGQRPTTGYTTMIEHARLASKQLSVRYRIDAPAQAGTASRFVPVHIALLPLSRQRGDFDQVRFEMMP